MQSCRSHVLAAAVVLVFLSSESLHAQYGAERAQVAGSSASHPSQLAKRMPCRFNLPVRGSGSRSRPNNPPDTPETAVRAT